MMSARMLFKPEGVTGKHEWLQHAVLDYEGLSYIVGIRLEEMYRKDPALQGKAYIKGQCQTYRV